jgi:hypothetical protein
LYAFGDTLDNLEYPNLRRRNVEYTITLELKNSYSQDQENYPFQALNVFLKKHIMLKDERLIEIKRFFFKCSIYEFLEIYMILPK